jgi:ribonucleoside-diphosphate reductase alpha chain
MAAALTDNALTVLRRRYLARSGTTVETPADLWRRVARHVAEADFYYGADRAAVDKLAERFAARMAALEFLPNSPTLMNAGRPLGQLAACFVVPVDDTTTGIFDAVGWAAQIQKTGGGTGFSFSRLRPAGDTVASTNGISSGPVAFMQVFDVATEAIKQGGTRRGANMGMLRVDHPDILEFIAIKLDPSRMRNFNLSVAITDAFMLAAERGHTYELVNPRSNEPVRRLDARHVLDAIVNAAWAVGDPGLVFIDRVNATQPTPTLGRIEATNPCGEQPLLPFESCTLGSINLAKFVKKGELERERLVEAIHEGVHFLDNVIDSNRYPLPQIDRATKTTRKIGLGVMGWADLLAELGIAYDSAPAIELAEDVAGLLDRESLAASEVLAERRGPFPAWEGSAWEKAGRRVRNATTTTVAPTGTISIIAGCSSGIEPLYALAYQRNVLDGEVLTEVNPSFRAAMESRGAWSDGIAARIAETGSARDVDGVPGELAVRYPTAHDVDIEWHVRMQAAWQRSVHAGVSKTINLRHDAKPDDVRAAYRMAFEQGCKGITIYRDGSRDGQVLTTGDGNKDRDGDKRACPECGGALVVNARCTLCRSCGWSVCG